MDNNWIVDNLENALTTWNEKLAEMWTLLTESPQTFKGGTIWSTVTTINVMEGDTVSAGQTLLVLEAMKMENNIDAERGGVVKQILVSGGATVMEGDVLMVIE